MTAPMDRRGFLGRGALALGAIAGVPSALSAATPSAATAETSEATRAALERARRILATPRATYYVEHVCSCPACEATKAERFDCIACGFSGAPLTVECTCQVGLIGHIAFNQASLADGAPWPPAWKVTPDEMERQTRVLRSLGDVGRCAGNGRGMPDVSSPARGMHSFEGNCSHATPVCPVCGDWGDGETTETSTVGFLALLRELNAALTASVA